MFFVHFYLFSPWRDVLSREVVAIDCEGGEWMRLSAKIGTIIQP